MQDFAEYMNSFAGQAMLLTFAGTAAAEGLVAIWAANSRVHWFVRAAAVWGAVMLLAPIRAYEPAAVFAIASPLTVALVGAVKWLERRGQPAPAAVTGIRFGLRDLFFLLLLVGLIVAGLQKINQRFTWQEWLGFGVWGGLVAVMASLSYGCVVSRWRLVLAPLLAVVVPVTARVAPGIVGAFFAERFIECVGLGRAFVWTGMQKLLALEIVYAEMAGLIMVVSFLAMLANVESKPALVRRVAGAALAAMTVCGGLLLTGLYWQMYWVTPIPPAFGSGTTHFAEIAAIVRNADPKSYWGAPIPPQAGNTPRALVVTGDRQALIEELLVLADDENYIPFPVHDKIWKEAEIKEFRRGNEHFCAFAQVIDDEAIRAGERGEYERAVELALLNIRVGTMLRRGGMESHAGTGKYCEFYGYERLTLIREKLSPETIRKVIVAVGRAAALPEDREVVWTRGRAFVERASGWTERLRTIFRHLAGVNHAWNPDEEITTFNILLQADYALRLFEHETGKLPERLEDLVPGYLPAVPLDPLAKSPQALRYRVESGQFLLYSVNPIGEDNGGEFGNQGNAMYSSLYDVDVESWTRP